jgi:Tannase-like family of unknown function (DUF6351)
MTPSLYRWIAAAAASVIPVATIAWTSAQERSDAARLTVTIVSSRADMITGGDALVRVTGTAAQSPLTAEINGKPVTLEKVAQMGEGAAGERPGQTGIVGLLTGIPLGKSTLRVKSAQSSATLELVNHPISGPVFSGPHQKPFVCQTESWKLGPPQDENCSAPTKVEWQYKSTVPVEGRGQSAFKPFDPSGPRPADLATATVNGGTVPYIVRLETGTINRAVYQIAYLHDPASPARPAFRPPPNWNGRLVYTFGGSCMAGYIQGASSGGVLNDLHLSRGYAVASSSLNVFGNNCNGVVSAETLMMVKERFIETVGLPRHTIGWGGSGGAMAQYTIAQNYPGLLDGIIPSATFPDAVTYFIESEDCRLVLRPYLNKTGLTEEQKRAIGGFSTWGTCDRSYANRPGRLDPKDCDANIPTELRYDPVTNPKGARCSIYDGMATIFTRDPKTGFARRPHDNTGVQYGLGALNAGVITKDDFLDLNDKAGGYDIDTKWQAARTAGDVAAIRIAFESGQTMMGVGGLEETPIIDARSYTDPTGDFHESYHSFKARARLIKANGHANNQVMLRGQGASFTRIQSEYLAQMDRWLDAIEADTSNLSRAEKIVRNKPADLVDACWTQDGRKIAEPAVFGKDSECNRLYPPHSAPRLEAGAPLADDIWKCQLKPIDWKDYKVTFSEAEKARLQKIFADGVCDWSKPSIGAAAYKGIWQRY